MTKYEYYKKFIGQTLSYEYAKESSILKSLSKVNSDFIVGRFQNKMILNIDICSHNGHYMSDIYNRERQELDEK